jgi:hypothetical protein
MTEPAASTLWTGPALLVPITVDALVLPQASYGQPWSWLAPNYGFVRLFRVPSRLFQNVAPAPIDPVGNQGALPGVVVRWALPDALTAGGTADSTTGQVPFPPVPNRWLVLRRVPGSSDATAAWILASDYLGGTGSSYYAQGAATALGKCWPLPSWPGEATLPAGLDPPLTALGPGDPNFAAYLPNVQHIFALHDPLINVNPGPVSYMVAGWYGGTVTNPLAALVPGAGDSQAADDWAAAVLSQLGWSTGNDLNAAIAAGESWATAHGYTTDPANPRTFLPSRTVCHGLVSQVPWPGANGALPLSGVPQYNPNQPASTQPGLSVGHTAVDAVATTVATATGTGTAGPDSPTQVAEALTALLSDLLPLLEEPDGSAQLALRLQDNWFQQSPGGTRWVVTAAQDVNTPSGAAATPLTQAQAQALDALNAAQQQVDATTRLVASLQWDIYALWWKQSFITANPTIAIPLSNAQQVIATLLTGKQTDTTQALNTLAAATTQRDTAKQTLTAQLGTLILKQVPEPPFWRPNDPALLIQGVGRSYAHGEDGRFSADGGLYCRFTGQTLDALQVTGTTTPVTAQTPALGLSPLAIPADAPPELGDLATEAFFLDLGNAHAIAVAAGQPALPDSVVQTQQTLVWNTLVPDPTLDQQTTAHVAGLSSAYGPVAVPSKVAVEYWAPPWAPLYLDWSATYYPTSPPTSGWTFPPVSPATPLDAQTAQWTGGAPATGAPLSLRGRTLLTPQASDALANRLEQLKAQFGNAAELQPYQTDIQDAINYLSNASVLSQTISGFGDLLLHRDPTQNQQPDLTTLGPWLAPPGGPAFTPTAAPAPDSGIPLSPIRAGFLSVAQPVNDKLWVVDDFGQYYDVLSRMAAHPPPQGQELGPDLGPAQGQGLIQLRPRLTQPNRLLLRFLDAADDTAVVGLSATANPVCGWLIPNRLDDSLMVYDAAGVLRGELLLAQSAGAQAQALWLPAPDLTPPAAQTSPPTLDDPHLRALVKAVLKAASPATVLADLLATVEKASWAIAPGGPGAAQLATLIGFPVAVARAQLLLELAGNPATSQAWADTGKDLDGGISQASFPVQLGSGDLDDDGLVGWFADADPAHLSSPYGPSASRYVTTAPAMVSVGTPVPMTVLLHPQGTVHAFTGLLPPVSASLPAQFQLAPIRATEVTFRAGPLLTPATAVEVALPAFGGGEWAWLQYAGAADPALPRPPRPASTTARLADAPPVLRDGWLRLTLTAQPTQLTYALTPTALSTGTAPGTSTGGIPPASLALTAYNANPTAVNCESITVTLPVGTDAGALTNAPELIVPVTDPSGGWNFQADSATGPGTFTVTPGPAGPAVKSGDTLTFTLTGISVSPAPGLSVINIQESTGDTPANAALTLERFPPA